MSEDKKERIPFTGKVGSELIGLSKSERKEAQDNLRRYLKLGRKLVEGTGSNRSSRSASLCESRKQERGGKLVVNPYGKYVTRLQTIVVASEEKLVRRKNSYLKVFIPTKINTVLHYDKRKAI